MFDSSMIIIYGRDDFLYREKLSINNNHFYKASMGYHEVIIITSFPVKSRTGFLGILTNQGKFILIKEMYYRATPISDYINWKKLMTIDMHINNEMISMISSTDEETRVLGFQLIWNSCDFTSNPSKHRLFD